MDCRWSWWPKRMIRPPDFFLFFPSSAPSLLPLYQLPDKGSLITRRGKMASVNLNNFWISPHIRRLLSICQLPTEMISKKDFRELRLTANSDGIKRRKFISWTRILKELYPQRKNKIEFLHFSQKELLLDLKKIKLFQSWWVWGWIERPRPLIRWLDLLCKSFLIRWIIIFSRPLQCRCWVSRSSATRTVACRPTNRNKSLVVPWVPVRRRVSPGGRPAHDCRPVTKR